MDKKIFNQIVEEYAQFNIPQEQVPSYENPYQFAQMFKQCSVVEYRNVSYSNTAVPIDKKA